MDIQTVIVAFLLGATPATPPVAHSDAQEARRLHIGTTGIMCARLPCPHRGIFEPGEDGTASRHALLHADLYGQTPLPEMTGQAEALAAVEQAWTSRSCIAIDGAFLAVAGKQPVLRIDQVVGPCHDK